MNSIYTNRQNYALFSASSKHAAISVKIIPSTNIEVIVDSYRCVASPINMFHLYPLQQHIDFIRKIFTKLILPFPLVKCDMDEIELS